MTVLEAVLFLATYAGLRIVIPILVLFVLGTLSARGPEQTSDSAGLA